MIKCMECGFETNRLQWTHFRYKCTGRFKNSSEYLKSYPNAKIVDQELAQRTTLTESKFIEKYGEIDGLKRWNIYREKQAYSNSFEYKKEKHGWDRQKFDDYNSSRSITLEKCINRHGEEYGIYIWNSYVEQQKYTKTKNYLVDKYGEKIGIEKFNQINRLKSASVNPRIMAELKNISIDEAVEIITSRQNFTKYVSLLEKEFIEKLKKIIGELEYTSISRPYGKWSTLLNSYVVYDIKHKDCIIEFNGDYWHCNPKLFESTDIGPGNKLASEIWNRDSKKIQTAVNLGFRTATIWESDYRKTKQKVIEGIVEWMQSGQK